MAGENFRTTRRVRSAAWLSEGEGELVGYSLDLIRDAFVRRLELGHLARFPQNDPTGATTAPDDALRAMGRDRRVVRGIDETSASYAARLRRWLDDRRTAGNPFTLMRQLAAYVDFDGSRGCSFRTVDVRGNWYSRASDGTESAVLKQANWDWDGDHSGTRWSRFWVIVYPGTRWTNGGGTWAGVASATWGSSAEVEHVASMRSIVKDWKPGGTRCVNIILAFDPASFAPGSPEPDGLWARHGKTVNGVRVASRLSTARYWDGV